MKKEYRIIQPKNKIKIVSNEFISNFEKAILLTLLDKQILDKYQYDRCIKKLNLE